MRQEPDEHRISCSLDQAEGDCQWCEKDHLIKECVDLQTRLYAYCRARGLADWFLVVEHLGGCSECRAYLLRQCGRALRRYGQAGVPEECEVVSQELFVRLCKTFRKGGETNGRWHPEKGPLANYLKVIATRLVLGMLRKTPPPDVKILEDLGEEDEPGLLSELPAPFEASDPVEPLIRRDQQQWLSRRLMEEVKQLPLAQRQIATLRFIEGKKWKEVAQALGKSVATVWEDSQNAIDSLRSRLRGEFESLFS